MPSNETPTFTNTQPYEPDPNQPDPNQPIEPPMPDGTPEEFPFIEPKHYPIHPDIPTQPIHEPMPGRPIA